ncbi:MAG: glycosyltransferase [Candidatus Yanofskybacteria bacterium]|nr:glycosyltransferase [Candidatus Yanofskybacteria bacterium]
MKTFEYYPQPDNIYYLVPRMWPIKGGKHIFRPSPRKNVITVGAFFSHSNYPLIGGVLKGWMPMFPWILIKQRPDIVLSISEPNLLSTLYEGLFSRILGIKHIVFTWENVAYETKFKGLRGMIQKLIVRLNFMFCEGVVCGSRRALEIMRQLTDKPTAVMPAMGLDVDYFKRDYSKKSFRGMDLRDYIVFGFAGVVAQRKGVHLIIRAFKEISETIPNVRLILAGPGEGEYGLMIDSMIDELKLKDLVIRIPWLDRDGVWELCNSSDVFVYPSIPYGGWEDQLPYSVQEASSMELPVISTNSGSISEILIDGETGILVKSYEDHRDLKDAMEMLAKDKEKRISMGQAGRRLITDNYSQKVVAGKFYDFFQKI